MAISTSAPGFSARPKSTRRTGSAYWNFTGLPPALTPLIFISAASKAISRTPSLIART